jgi:hypothetical protein
LGLAASSAWTTAAAARSCSSMASDVRGEEEKTSEGK